MRSNRLSLLLTTAFLCAGSLAAPGFAAAQTTGAEREDEEIVVTAQRRAQSNEDVPISVTALSAEQLENSGADSVNSLQQLVPGMRVDLAGGFSQPTIRGVGSSIAGTGFSSNVATYVDGYYQPSPATTDMQLLNLESVQVLKGPQGTLFGRNATGGAVLLTTRDPSFTPTLHLRGSYESYDRQTLNFYGSTGLGENLAVDIALLHDTGDGFVDNIVTGADDDGAFDTTAVRASVLWNATDDISFRLAYAHSDRDDPYPVVTGAYQGLSAGTPFGAVVATENGEVSNTSRTAFTAESDALYLTSTFDLGWARLVSYTMSRNEESRTDLDLDSSSFPIFDVFFTPENDAFSQEFNLSGATSRLDWLVGLYYLNYREEYTDFEASAGGSPFTTLYNLGSEIDAYALYADLTYQFADRWFFTLGARYSQEEGDAFFNVQPAGVAFGLAPAAGLTEFSNSWDDFSPRVALRYQLDDDSNIYASYSRGFKSGLNAPSSFSTTPVEPETIDAYEIGYKRASGGSNLSLSAFYYDYQDLQLASYNGVQAIVTNAANSTIYGAELQYSNFIGDRFRYNVGLAYTHGEYEDFPGAPVFIQDLNPMSPTFGLFPPSTVDASGFEMQRTPEFTAAIGASYETELGGGSLDLSGDLYYTSDFFFDPAQQFSQDAYSVLNLRAAWTMPNNHVTFAVFGNNVLDEEYVSQVLPGTFAIQQTYGAPATVGVSVSLDY